MHFPPRRSSTHCLVVFLLLPLAVASCGDHADQQAAKYDIEVQDSLAPPPTAEDFNFTQPAEGVKLTEVGE